MANLVNYYERDLSATYRIENEYAALQAVVRMNVEVQAASREEKRPEGVAGRPDIRSNNHLLQKIWSESQAAISKTLSAVAHVKMSPKNIENVTKFLQEADLSSIHLDHPQAGAACNEMSEQIRKIYRIHTKRFIKKEVPPALRDLSCLHYAIHKAGFDMQELGLRQAMYDQERELTLADYIVFLEEKGMQQAQLPFQPGDIILYFDQDNVFQHAAFVDKKPALVHAKFGNATPFAYLHYEAETPSSYGTKFQIFRK